MKYMSAKDKAFQAERQRLIKESEKWRKMVIERDQQLYERDKKIAELESKIEELYQQIEDHLNMTPEQFDEHIHKDMRRIEAIEFLRSMANGMSLGLY